MLICSYMQNILLQTNFFLTAENVELIICVAFSIFNGVLLSYGAYKFFNILQAYGYNVAKYFRWLFVKCGGYMGRLLVLTFLSVGSLCVTNALFAGYGIANITYAGLLFYVIFFGMFIKAQKRETVKKPLVVTARIKRLIIVFFLLCAGMTFGLMRIDFIIYGISFKHSLVTFTPVLMPFVLIIAFYITYPLEKLNYIRYLLKAKRKLAKLPNLIKIGITGSFGKTSTKFILDGILKNKYKVCTSPESYNTPMGLCKVILNKLSPEDEILIAEMGARHKGDIKYLCNFIEPKYGILTGVGNQHLETFKTRNAIEMTKIELPQSLKRDGAAIFNADNKTAKRLAETITNTKVILTGCSVNYPVRAENIVSTPTKTSFDLVIYDNPPVNVTTGLVGEHNVSNILTASALAYELNLSVNEIAKGISELQPVEHRFKISQSNGITIIDDAFNASVESTAAALKTLSKFSGRKIVVTPGLVELGADEWRENLEFGKNLAISCDYVILVGKKRSIPIIMGFKEEGFFENSYYVACDLNDASSHLKHIVKQGDVVLFENDLPFDY